MDPAHDPVQHRQGSQGTQDAEEPGVVDRRAGQGEPAGQANEVERRLIEERLPRRVHRNVLV
jgi:hypothetical protein